MRRGNHYQLDTVIAMSGSDSEAINKVSDEGWRSGRDQSHRFGLCQRHSGMDKSTGNTLLDLNMAGGK